MPENRQKKHETADRSGGEAYAKPRAAEDAAAIAYGAQDSARVRLPVYRSSASLYTHFSNAYLLPCIDHRRVGEGNPAVL